MMPMQFTYAEHQRKHGEKGPEGTWDSMCMGWRTPTGMFYPDHERMRQSQEGQAVIAAVHRLTSLPRKHLKLVSSPADAIE